MTPQTNWCVITGGPSSGKTTTVNMLRDRGQTTTIEHARHYIDTQRVTGRTVAEITASTRQVAEGVKSCASITELAAKHQVEMPIVENVAAVIAGELTPAEMITALMSRSAKPERY